MSPSFQTSSHSLIWEIFNLWHLWFYETPRPLGILLIVLNHCILITNFKTFFLLNHLLILLDHVILNLEHLNYFGYLSLCVPVNGSRTKARTDNSSVKIKSWTFVRLNFCPFELLSAWTFVLQPLWNILLSQLIMFSSIPLIATLGPTD